MQGEHPEMEPLLSGDGHHLVGIPATQSRLQFPGSFCVLQKAFQLRLFFFVVGHGCLCGGENSELDTGRSESTGTPNAAYPNGMAACRKGTTNVSTLRPNPAGPSPRALGATPKPVAISSGLNRGPGRAFSGRSMGWETHVLTRSAFVCCWGGSARSGSAGRRASWHDAPPAAAARGKDGPALPWL